MVAFHFVLPGPLLGCCVCRLTVTLKWNGVIINVISYTCVFSVITVKISVEKACRVTVVLPQVAPCRLMSKFVTAYTQLVRSKEAVIAKPPQYYYATV